MNPYTSQHPEAPTAQSHGTSSDRHDPTTNHYAAQQQNAHPNVDSGAVSLSTSEMQRLNRSALGLLAGIFLLLAVAAFWLFKSSNTTKPPTSEARDEIISVSAGQVGIGATPDAPPAAAPGAASIVDSRRTSGPSFDSGASHRSPPPTSSEGSTVPAYAPPMAREPTLLERRIAAANAGGIGVGDAGAPPRTADMPVVPGMPLMPGLSGMPGGPGAPAEESPLSANGNLAYSAKALAEVSSATPLQHPDALMLRGTLIRCVLETRIVTDNPGFTSCTVTEPIYSFTGKRLLLPKGSKVMGKYEMEPSGPRLAVIWDRVVTPTGIDVSMQSPGVDTLGGSGHPGHYSAHWGSRITAALFISLLSDAFKYAGAEYGPKQTSITNGVVTQSPFESNTAETVQQLAGQAVRRQANRPATVTINQGTVLAIYVAKDVDFASVVARY